MDSNTVVKEKILNINSNNYQSCDISALQNQNGHYKIAHIKAALQTIKIKSLDGYFLRQEDSFMLIYSEGCLFYIEAKFNAEYLQKVQFQQLIRIPRVDRLAFKAVGRIQNEFIQQEDLQFWNGNIGNYDRSVRKVHVTLAKTKYINYENKILNALIKVSLNDERGYMRLHGQQVNDFFNIPEMHMDYLDKFDTISIKIGSDIVINQLYRICFKQLVEKTMLVRMSMDLNATASSWLQYNHIKGDTIPLLGVLEEQMDMNPNGMLKLRKEVIDGELKVRLEPVPCFECLFIY